MRFTSNCFSHFRLHRTAAYRELACIFQDLATLHENILLFRCKHVPEVTLEMRSQQRLLTEGVLTDAASVTGFPDVSPQVTLQCLQTAERSIADLALKPLFLGVYITVVLHEITQLRERFSTVNTFIGSLSGMNADVRAEVVSTSEGSPTPLTLVALLACVSPDVVHERAGVREASSADVALVRFLSSVGSKVYFAG